MTLKWNGGNKEFGIPFKDIKYLSERQCAFLKTYPGIKFYFEFIQKHGKHIFVFGGTGSGKTQKAYWLLDWLKHRETQIWISTGKSGEILPLLFMGKKIRIITPARTDVIIEEKINGEWQRVTENIEYIYVETPEQMLDELKGNSYPDGHHPKKSTINILEIRNAFAHYKNALAWMAELFEKLAYKCRLGDMPSIFPASLHIDETQWAMAGKRISGEGERNRVSEVVTENALELRSIGIRLCLYAQSYKNIPPPARENMSFSIICRGGMVEPEENQNLAQWCNGIPRRRSPMRYKPEEGRFVFEDGFSSPPLIPWEFPLFPELESDRERLQRMRVRYVGRFDEKHEENEIQEECLPELGRFSALVIPPEARDTIMYSRFDAPGIEGDSE